VGRILFVDSWTDLGGGQRLLLDLVDHLGAAGHACAVAFPSSGPVRKRLDEQGVATFDYALPAMPAGPKTLGDRARFLAGTRGAAASLTEVGRRFGAELVFCMGGRPALSAA